MRIAYGIFGYGRGHATRAMSVLPQLAQQHELLILAGGEAYQALEPYYDIVSVPELRYRYNSRGQISCCATMYHNLPILRDLHFVGPISRRVQQQLKDFGTDVAIVDCEPFTVRMARKLSIPTISFDNFGALLYGENDLSWWNKIQVWGYSIGNRALLPAADRIVISSILPWPTHRANAIRVAPVVREEIRQRPCTRGRHLLAYISQGDYELTPRLEEALANLSCPVRLYGTSRVGHKGCIQFKAMDNESFIEDLASCRAVFGTVGNQIVSEVAYLGKPMLGMPVKCIEQVANADMLIRLGIGMSVNREQVTTAILESFLAREPEFLRHARPGGWPELPDAADALLQAIGELANGPNAIETAKARCIPVKNITDLEPT